MAPGADPKLIAAMTPPHPVWSARPVLVDQDYCVHDALLDFELLFQFGEQLRAIRAQFLGRQRRAAFAEFFIAHHQGVDPLLIGHDVSSLLCS